MKTAKLLLERVTELIPPGQGELGPQRHNLTVQDDVLVLSLMLDDRYMPIYFEEKDLDFDNIEDTALNIYSLMQAELTRK